VVGRQRPLLAAAALALLAACDVVGGGILPGRAREAQWALAPDVELRPGTTELPLLVGEVACASGRTAEGRVDVDVEYGEDVVVLTARVRPLPGGQDCPGNPPTPYVVRLDEPLGDRALVNGADDEIARRPLEVDADAPATRGDLDLGDGVSLSGPVLFVVEALQVRARDPDELADIGDLSPAADGIDLLLGDRVVRTATPDELRDPRTWVLPVEEHAGFAGPFDVLGTLARAERLTVSVGARPHCAGPPHPSPDAYADLLRVALEPAEHSSCIEWFVVNLYLDGDDRLQAVQLDLFGP
jgi:hypothetical protein